LADDVLLAGLQCLRESDASIDAGATILGGGSVIGRGSIIGGNVWLTSSVPPNTRVYNKTSEQEMYHG
jgi:serine O-acetyltransferase